MRKLLKWLGGAICLIVLILILTPYLFKGRLIEAAKQGLNENLRAKSDFQDVYVSFFRSFPHLQVTLSDLTIDGIDDFEGVPLFHAKSVSVAVNFWSVISKDKPIEIVSLSADTPLINILTLADGKVNYDITLPAGEESTPSESTIQLQLADYSFTDGLLRYEDRTMPMTLALDNFNHRGVGNFADMQFDLKTFTEVDWFSFNYNGVTYLDSTKAKLDAVISMNLDDYRYTLKDNQLLLNALELNGEGFIDLNDDDIELDLSLSAPKSDFRQLFSILPGAYSKGFQQADIKGTFDLQNRIWGRYSDEQYPAFTLKTKISDGSVKYPDLPVGISNINMDLAIDKPDGALDLMKILLSKLAIQIGPQPINGHLAISTPVSDPNVEGSLQGILNLSDLAKAYPIQDMQGLEGKIDADVKFKARMSQIDQKKYDQVMIAGALTAENLSAQMTGKPLVKITRTRLDFSPQVVRLSETTIQAGKSDLTIEGTLDNILALISPEKTLQGRVRMRSELLDLDEWSGPGTGTPPSETVVQTIPGAPTMIPAYDLDLDLMAKEVIMRGEKINNPVLSGRIRPDEVEIRELSASTRGSDLRMQGDLQNLSDYLAGQGTLKGDIQIQSKKLDLNPFMGAPEANPSDTSSLSPFVIPDHLDLKIDARIEEFVYTDMSFRNVKGQILVAENTATLQDCSSEAFGGKFQLAGGYQTLAGQQPNFDLKYDMTDVQFSQIAQKFSYIKVLAPIIKFLEGRFSTSFITNGALKDDFMPDLASLNLSGLVETSECLLKSFGPAEELAQRLKLKFLQSPRIQNSKNWLEVKNGMVEVKEFDTRIEDINFQISGTQSLSLELNYLIKMKVPRKYLEATELTKGLNEQFSWLTTEANKLGFKLSSGEFVNVNVIMNGTITKPTFYLKLVGMDGEKPLVDVLKDEVKQGVEHIIDSAKTVAEAKRDSLIKRGEEKIDKVVDTLSKEAQKVVDTLTNRATEELKNKVDDEISKRASEVIDQKVGEVGGEKAKEEVDKVVDKLKSWKPFEKKKTTPPDTTKTGTKKED